MRKIFLTAGSAVLLMGAEPDIARAVVTADSSAWPPGDIQDLTPRTTGRAEAPNGHLAFEFVNVPLGAALEEIARQAGLTLAYDTEILPAGRTATLRVDGISAREALLRVLEGTALEPILAASGQLTLSPRSTGRTQLTESALVNGDAPSTTIAGRVTDAETGRPLGGATVRVDGTRHGTVTNVEGTYRIENVPPGRHTVVVSMIGYDGQRQVATVSEGATVSLDFVLTVSAVPLDEMVVTGTMVPTRMRAVPSPVSVITAQDIERKGMARFEDILRSIPGVGVVSNNGQDHLSVLYVRGASTFIQGQSTIKTYIDGVEVANPVYSLNQIDLASIERIELIRGPQASTLYGSEAIAGVLQIFTKKGHPGAERSRLQATLSGGGLESRYSSGLTPVQQHSIEVISSERNLSYRLGAAYSYTGEWVDDELLDDLGWDVRNSVIEDLGLSGGLRYVNGRLTAEASAQLHRKSSGAPLNEAVAEPARTGRWNYAYVTKPSGLENEFDLETYGLNLQYAATANWRHRLKLGRDGTQAEFRQPQPRLVTPADTFLLYQSIDWVKRSLAYSTALQLDLGARLTSTLQAGFDWSTFSQRTVITQDAKQLVGGFGNQTANLTAGDVTNHGSFVQMQAAWRDQLFLTMGLRADRSTGFGGDRGYAWSPRIGLTHVLDLGAVTFKSRAAYGSAIRPPQAEQRLGQTLANFVTMPNDQLAPERQSGYDLGLELYVGPRFSVSVTRFDQRADDLVASVRLSEPSAVPTVSQFQNVGRIKNEGWELEGEATFGRVTASGSYSLIDSTVEQLSLTYTGSDFVVGERPLGTPRRTGAFSVAYAAPTAGIALGMSYKGPWRELHYVPYFEALLGTDPDRDPFTGNLRDYIASYPSVHRYELNVTYKLARHIDGLLMIDNLLNDTTPDELDIDLVRGRQVVVGVRINADL